MPFAAIWIDLEMIKISEVSRTERLISYDVTYVWNLKNKKNKKKPKLISQTVTQTQKTNLWLKKGKGGEG